MKNQFIIPSIIIAAAILGGFWMLKPPAAPLKAPDNSIHRATEQGNIEAVMQHLAAGTDVNAVDNNSLTPLFHALFSEKELEMIKLLISKGADVNATKEGMTLLDFAIEKGELEVAELLRKHGGKMGEELKAEGK